MSAAAAEGGGGSAETRGDIVARVRKRRMKGLWIEDCSATIFAEFVSACSLKSLATRFTSRPGRSLFPREIKCSYAST